MKTYTDRQIEKELSEAPYNPKPYEKDGVTFAKAGLRFFRKIKENKWELISENGLPVEKCNSIRFDRNGRAY